MRGRRAIALHWLIAVLMLGNIALVWAVDFLPDERIRLAIDTHKSIGITVLGLPLSGWMHDSAWKAADTHPMTLFGLVPWPRIGWIMGQAAGFKEQLHSLFGEAHELLAWALYLLFALHLLGALKHQWVDKQAILKRMWFR